MLRNADKKQQRRSLTVIGIGYHQDDITAAGLKAIAAADTVIVKSARHALPDLTGKVFTALDDVFDNAPDFDTLNRDLAARVTELARGNTVYLVPGNGITDNSLKALTGYRLIKGVSEIPDMVCEAYTVMPAYEIAAAQRLNLNTDIPLVVTEIDNAYLAGDVKLKLLDAYAAGTAIRLDGKDDVLENLDRHKRYGYQTAAVICPVPLIEKKRFNLNDLLRIMDRLMAPDGCPWDKAQTHESIKVNLIEEAYEAADAIDSGDLDNMCEEFGDVLLQAVFQSTIAERAGEFNLTDVVSELCGKLIYRHTHVFGGVKADDPAGALRAWEAAKSKEKGQDTLSDAIAAIPESFPALLRAVKVQGKAKKGGLDFKGAADAWDSLNAEIAEFHRAESEQDRYDEMGDILFSVCNAARLSGIQPETALNSSINKFNRRFKYVEDKVTAAGKTMKALTQLELDALWQESKRIDENR